MKTRNVIWGTLILTFALCVSATAQSIAPSTPTTPTALNQSQAELHKEAAAVNKEVEALRLQLRMRRMLAEVKASRTLVTAQADELGKADAELKAEKENSASLERSNKEAVGEIGHLRAAIVYKNEALEAKTETISVLKERNDELKRSASKNRKRAFWATAAAAILGGVLVMK